jgi:hypothetical protein
VDEFFRGLQTSTLCAYGYCTLSKVPFLIDISSDFCSIKFSLSYSHVLYDRELLQSEFLNEPRDYLEEREAAIQLRERIEEQELLLEFLLPMQQ